MVHLLGFVGSALIVTGVMMRRVAWLRVFGLAGSLIFIVYGALLGAWPVVVTNVTTTSLHVFHLQSHVRSRRTDAALSGGGSTSRRSLSAAIGLSTGAQ